MSNVDFDMQKIKILLPHLLKHNDEHAREMEKWVNLIEAAGSTEVASELREVLTCMVQVSDHLQKAIEVIGDDSRTV